MDVPWDDCLVSEPTLETAGMSRANLWSPLLDFKANLRLHKRQGLSYQAMEELAHEKGLKSSRSTLQRTDTGTYFPVWDAVRVYVTLVGADEVEWRQIYRQLLVALAPIDDKRVLSQAKLLGVTLPATKGRVEQPATAALRMEPQTVEHRGVNRGAAAGPAMAAAELAEGAVGRPTDGGGELDQAPPTVPPNPEQVPLRPKDQQNGTAAAPPWRPRRWQLVLVIALVVVGVVVVRSNRASSPIRTGPDLGGATNTSSRSAGPGAPGAGGSPSVGDGSSTASGARSPVPGGPADFGPAQSAAAAYPSSMAATSFVLTIDDRVTSGAFMREDSPVYLSTRPANYCKRDRCAVEGTERNSNQRYESAVCTTTGDRTTNGDDESAADDSNPALYSSTRWYGVRLADGTFGYVSEVWVTASQRGGSGLPAC